MPEAVKDSHPLLYPRRLANSAIFGLSRPVASPADAASMLGIDTIKTLVLSSSVFQRYHGVEIAGFSIDEFFQHSLKVAQLSSRLAKAEKLSADAVKDAFTAGVLHDVGKLVLATSAPQQYAQAIDITRREHVPLWQAERGVFGACHAALGAHLLSLWGLPQSIVEIVALHHAPGDAREASFSALSAVVVGNLLSRGDTDQPGEGHDNAWTTYFAEIGCADRLPTWRDVCLQDSE